MAAPNAFAVPEERIREIGRDLFGRVRGDAAGFLAGDRLTAPASLAWAMTDEDASCSSLIRADVLPALGDATETVAASTCATTSASRPRAVGRSRGLVWSLPDSAGSASWYAPMPLRIPSTPLAAFIAGASAPPTMGAPCDGSVARG